MTFQRSVSIALFITLVVSCCFGQTATPPTPPTLPSNFAAAGLGFQSTATPQTSGWLSVCHRNPDLNIAGLALPSFLCASTDYSAAATSARVDLDTIVLQKSVFAAGFKTGGGAAINSNGVGGSYALGGFGVADISSFVKIAGARLAASITWQKDDVAAASQGATVPIVLQQLGARATFRFGFGKSW